MDFTLFNNVSIRDLTPEERHLACLTLHYEYRGSGAVIDQSNISNLARGLSSKRLSSFALHMGIVQDIADVENKNFVNPPTLYFETGAEKPISKKLQDYISDRLEQMRFNEFMLTYERQAALEGTVFVRPVISTFDGSMNLFSLTPAEASLKVVGDLDLPGKPAIISYNTGSVSHTWDYTNYSVTTPDGTFITPHLYKESIKAIGGLPFAVLNYFPDNSCVFGPPDGTLYSFCHQRSLVLANVCAKLHLTDQEKLVLTGVESFEEAMKLVRDRVIMLPNNKNDDSGTHIDQSAQFIAPNSDDAMKLFKTYLEMYYHLKDIRGHSPKNFTRGSDPQSAEAVRLGGVDMRDKNAAKRLALSRFLKDLWKRIIWANNTQEQPEMLIPEDTKLTIDWKPDGLSFNSAQDEVTYFNAAMLADVETPITWLRTRNPELSEEEAQALYDRRKEFNAQDKGADVVVRGNPISIDPNAPVDPNLAATITPNATIPNTNINSSTQDVNGAKP